MSRFPERINSYDSPIIVTAKQAINDAVFLGKPVMPEVKEVIQELYPGKFNFHKVGSWANYIYRM